MKKNIKKVAIQGAYGAFHEEAAKRYFKGDELEIVPCYTFPDVVQEVESGSADYAMMAIENTVAGSILPNYALLQDSQLQIVGEYYMRIVQNLLTLEGASLEKLTEVYSHPMAILQSRRFFKQYPHIRLVESADTALSAKDVVESGDITRGAIAAETAAERYGLKILAGGIEDNKKNYTRFFVLGSRQLETEITAKTNKASVCFSLPHATGSLAAVLSVFAFYGINLHKIQSHPIIGQPGQYSFYVDLVFADYQRYKQCLQAITPLTANVLIFGEYEEGYQSYRKIHNGISIPTM